MTTQPVLFNVMDYGAVGDGVIDDSAAIQAAIAAAAASNPGFKGHYSKATVYLPPCSFRVAASINVAPQVTVEGYGATLVGPITAYPRVTATTSVAVTVADQTGGACFTDNLGPTGVVYWPEFRGLTLYGFRYGFCSACLAWNTAVLRDIMFYDCDLGVFCFQGSQDWVVHDFESTSCYAVFVAAATAMVPGSGLPTDNYFCDSLSMRTTRYTPGAVVNAVFDAWFSASILKPNTADVTGWLMGAPVAYQQVSGRIIYIPSRSTRDTNGHDVGPISAYGCARGIMLTANPVNCRFHDLAGEQCFAGDTSPPTQAIVTVLKMAQWKTHGIMENIDAVNSTSSPAPNAIVFVPYAQSPLSGAPPESAFIGNNIHGVVSDATQFVSLINNSMLVQ